MKEHFSKGTVLTLLLVASLSVSSGVVYAQEFVRPEQPLIMRDVALVNENIEFTHPVIPGNRTTQDGRLALVVESLFGLLRFLKRESRGVTTLALISYIDVRGPEVPCLPCLFAIMASFDAL